MKDIFTYPEELEEAITDDGLVAARDEQFDGTYDEAAGPAQMEAVHKALIVYFGTENWMEERKRQMPGAHRYFFDIPS